MSMRMSVRRHPLCSIAFSLLVSACGGGGAHGAPVRASTRASDTTTSVPRASEDAGEQMSQPAKLTPARSVELALTGTGAPTPLTPALWSDPQSVAARFVLADSTYAANEDPAVVLARRGAFTTSRLAADLAASSSGAARLEELRRRQATFVGVIEAITTAEGTELVAAVELTVRVTLTTNDRAPDIRLRFYRLTLGCDMVGGRWLVVRAEQS